MRRGLLLLLVLVTVSISPLKTEARQIWLTPLDPVWRSIRNWPANDFMELFEDNAPWQQTASVISGFEISKRFVLEASDSDLLRVIAGLRRRNIALGVQGTPLIASAECGLGIEGHGPPHDMLAVAQRLRSLGADLRYVIFDEPLYYGHEFDGAPGARPCHAPIGIMAEQAAAKIAELRRIFPGVEVGAVEPFGIPRVDQSVWAADLEEWLKAYALAAGAPLAFLRADVVWRRPNWRAQFEGAVPLLRSLRIPLGVIYNSSPDVTSDREWTESTLRHARLIECELHVRPDQVVFQSWTDHPRQVMPEDQPGTLTNLILRYLGRDRCG
jgi:hypothetical protein